MEIHIAIGFVFSLGLQPSSLSWSSKYVGGSLIWVGYDDYLSRKEGEGGRRGKKRV